VQRRKEKSDLGIVTVNVILCQLVVSATLHGCRLLWEE
jgi:hypothetical protein